MIPRSVALALAVLATACASSADPRQAPSAAGQDVRLLAERMEAAHPDLFHHVSAAEFRSEAEGLVARAGGLGPDELLVELMRLAALPGERDGHTGVFPLDPAHDRPLHVVPIRLYDFPEGLFVVAEVGRLGLVGGRLVAVEGVPVGEVVRRVRPLVPHDNEWSLRARLPGYLIVAEVLRGIGIAQSAGPIRLTFRRAGRRDFDVSVDPIRADRYSRAFGDLFDPLIPTGLPRRPEPAYLARRMEPWWATMLAGGNVAYLAYNVTTVPTEGLGLRIRRLASRPGVRRVIVDLRHNPGGNLHTYPPLLEDLQRIDRPGRLVVLISRTTFSAAESFAVELDSSTAARFLGEPTGGSPNHYGDPATVSLPATGWSVRVATIHWRKAGPGDRRTAIEPDRRVELTAAEFFAGRDPVLRAAVALGG